MGNSKSRKASPTPPPPEDPVRGGGEGEVEERQVHDEGGGRAGGVAEGKVTREQLQRTPTDNKWTHKHHTFKFLLEAEPGRDEGTGDEMGGAAGERGAATGWVMVAPVKEDDASVNDCTAGTHFEENDASGTPFGRDMVPTQSRWTALLPPPSRTMNSLSSLSRKAEPLPPSTRKMESLPFLSRKMEPLPPSSMKLENLSPPSMKAENMPPPSMKAETLPPPSMKAETLPPPSMKVETLPPPSMKVETLPPPSMKVETLPPPSMKVETLPPPSMKVETLPPPSMKVETLPPPSMKLENLSPPSMKAENMPPPSMKAETLPPPSMKVETPPPPSMKVETLPPPSMKAETLPPPSTKAETLPPTSMKVETLPPPSVKVETLPSPSMKETLPPPSMKAETLPPPSMKTETLPPPSMKVETLPPPSMKGEMLPPPSMKVDNLSPTSMKANNLSPPEMKAETLPPPSMKVETLPTLSMKAENLSPLSLKTETLPPPSMKAENLSPPSMKTEILPPPSMKVETLPTLSMKAETLPPPSMKTETLPPPSMKAENLPSPSMKTETLPPPSMKAENLSPPSMKTETLPPPSMKAENLSPPSMKTERLPPPLMRPETLPTPLMKVEKHTPSRKTESQPKKVKRPRRKPKLKSSSAPNLVATQGECVRSWKEVERNYDLHLHQITRRSEDVLTRHYDKIADVEEQLEALQQGKRKMSLEELDERLKSRRALEDRLQELGLQKDEFLRHREDVLEQLQVARTTQDFEAMAIELRKNMATECGRLANAFPIYARRTDIVTTVKQNQVCVIIGETGSGKSTQMAQFFLQEGVARDGMVACTQPRKIAATSLATHVAREMGSEVGRLVGYKVGMHARRTDTTKILYMTDHVLLNECLQDPTLARYSCVIIDEAHERSIYTDLLLGMLRNCLRTRPELRIVITSATIKPDVFVRYFGRCPVVSVSGRMFPVEVEWQETQTGVDSFKNYQEAAVRKAVKVHRHEGQGDVLVFLTSPAETERCCQMFRNHLEGHPEDYVVQQLHGRLQSDEQQQVFHPAPEGRRKVVFATNSAETSVTIPGVKFVIDTGLVKEMRYDPIRRINSLTVTLVSQSSARQRQGRAGRLGPGKCFRLYTEQDYSNMAPDSLPEILKVHVGHAMLKLMELGVDPMQFEYIESPSREALEEALASLVALGAVAEGRITNLGRWVAKMPFDPRYGVLVHDAVRAGAGLEAIVVAATSGSGSVFYRGGSLMEKEAADKKKVSFCHEGGDQLTALNVFRAWHQVAERNQGRWCLNHAINGKTMRTVRETTREVLHTLDKELHACIPFKFGKTRTVDTILQGLLFRALKSYLSHYLGHPKAGYVPAFKDQRVELHPSCALLPLGRQPEWLVFEQVMRTSRDFAMQVTPVEESVVMQAVQDGWLQLDLEAAKKKRLVAACHETVGPQLFREVVGPRYSLLRAFEEKLAAAHPGCVVVVEAMEEKGVLQVFSSQQHLSALADSFTDIVPPLRAKFRAEESEETVGKRSQHGGVRAVVGAGGMVTDLLMPEEYTTVMVNCCRDAVDRLSEGEVARALGKHGAIKECIKFFRKNNNSTLWGKVVFEQREAAAAAVQETYDKQVKEKDRRAQQEDAVDQGKEKDPDDLQLSVRPNVRAARRHDAAFTARIQWCRRPSRGFGYVSFANVEDFMRAQMFDISVGGSFARVHPARRDEQTLYVGNFGPLVTEDVLRAAFAEQLNLHPMRDLTKVVVVREQRSLDPEHRHTCERRLRHKIEEFASREEFRLEVREPRSDRDVNYVGFCNFNNPEQGHAACAAIDNNFSISLDTKVSMRPNIRSSLFVHANMYALCGPQVEALVEELEGDQVRLAVKKLKNDNVIVEMHSNSVAALARVRSRLQEVVTGDVVECGNIPAAVALFSREGKRLLKVVMDSTHTLVLTDNRLKTVSIHGPAPQRQEAREQIMEQMQLLTGHRKNVQLRDGGRPRGLMKALMMKYGADLEELRDMAGLGAVTLNLRYHRLGLCGPRQAVEKASQAVEAVAAGLPQEEAADPADDLPECAACLCPVEDGTQCRLEYCGHAYCRECLAQHVNTAITSRAFPVECVQDGCAAPLIWRDFVNLSRCGQLTLQRLVEAAVAAHVQAHQRSLHYCIAPDCPAVYRTSEQGALFVCSECEAWLCTACHVQYHEGLTCAMYRSAGKDTGFVSWMGQDASNRKICPSCTTPIEKVEGCNKVSCIACKKVLCWVCLSVFPSNDECYRHLRKDHGGY